MDTLEEKAVIDYKHSNTLEDGTLSGDQSDAVPTHVVNEEADDASRWSMDLASGIDLATLSSSLQFYSVNGVGMTVAEFIRFKRDNKRSNYNVKRFIPPGLLASFKLPTQDPVAHEYLTSDIQDTVVAPYIRTHQLEVKGEDFVQLVPSSQATGDIGYLDDEGFKKATVTNYCNFLTFSKNVLQYLPRYKIDPPLRQPYSASRRLVRVAETAISAILGSENESKLADEVTMLEQAIADQEMFQSKFVETCENNFYGASGVNGQLGRLSAVISVHDRGTSLLEALVTLQYEPKDVAFILKSFKPLESRESYRLVKSNYKRYAQLVLQASGYGINQARMSITLSMRPDILHAISNETEPQLEAIGQLHTFVYGGHKYKIQDLGLQINPSLFKYKFFRPPPRSASGPIYKGNHLDNMAKEVASMVSLYTMFTDALVVSNDGTANLNLPMWNFLRTAKCVPKFEVYPIEKRGIKERNIFATNTLFYAPLQALVNKVNSNITRSSPYPGVVQLYGASQNSQTIEMLKEVETRLKLFVYSDNLFIATRDHHWYSFDGSTMEGSSSTLSCMCYTLHLLVQAGVLLDEEQTTEFVKNVITGELDYSDMVSLVRASAFRVPEIVLRKMKPPVDLEPIHRRALKYLQSTEGYIRYADTISINRQGVATEGAEHLKYLIYIATFTRGYISPQYVLWVLYSAWTCTNGIGLLGRQAFQIPGLMSGSALTFSLNNFLMTMIARQIYKTYFLTLDVDLEELAVTTADRFGVKLKLELHSPPSRSFLNPELPTGVYKADFLGFDVKRIEVEGVNLDIPVLAEDRLYKAMAFTKVSLSKDVQDMLDEKDAKEHFLDLLSILVNRSLYLIGGWAYAGPDTVLREMIANTQASLETPSTSDSNILRRFIKQFTDPDGLGVSSPTIEGVLTSVATSEDYSIPSTIDVLKIMGSSEIAMIMFSDSPSIALDGAVPLDNFNELNADVRPTRYVPFTQYDRIDGSTFNPYTSEHLMPYLARSLVSVADMQKYSGILMALFTEMFPVRGESSITMIPVPRYFQRYYQWLLKDLPTAAIVATIKCYMLDRMRSKEGDPNFNAEIIHSWWRLNEAGVIIPSWPLIKSSPIVVTNPENPSSEVTHHVQDVNIHSRVNDIEAYVANARKRALEGARRKAAKARNNKRIFDLNSFLDE